MSIRVQLPIRSDLSETSLEQAMIIFCQRKQPDGGLTYTPITWKLFVHPDLLIEAINLTKDHEKIFMVMSNDALKRGDWYVCATGNEHCVGCWT